jgi:hypothetical protein
MHATQYVQFRLNRDGTLTALLQFRTRHDGFYSKLLLDPTTGRYAWSLNQPPDATLTATTCWR